MEDAAKMELRHWANFDQTYLKEFFRNQEPSAKFDEVLGERDAAIAERDVAIAEKKSANLERDSALLQRDIAYADRHAAWVERDSALEALTMIQANESNSESAAKLMQVVNIAVDRFPVGSNLLCLPTTFNSINSSPIEAKPLQSRAKQRVKKAEKATTRKRKDSGATSQTQKGSKVSRKKRKQQAQQEAPTAKGEKIRREDASKSMVLYVAPIDMSSTTTPFCSCTGANRQCYRWGRGGWQSSCCTNFLSEYPLPVNHAKRGARVAGRKMSGGAFKKLLEKLAGDGFDITQPVDMIDHWAKHGTNRYIVIR